MKKHLIAAAVAGILAAPAMAQVTVYGIMDLAVRSSSPDVGPSTTTMVSGSFYTSRLGFKGTEDLGGGLKASFTLEGKVDADTGATTLGNRESSVALSGGFGEIRLGRTDTSQSEAVDLVAHFANMGNFGLNGAPEYTGDQPNTIRYTSPSMGGVTLQVGTSLGDERASGEDLNSISLAYAAGPLSIAVGFDDVGSHTTAQINHGRQSHNLDIRCGITLTGMETDSERTGVVPGTNHLEVVIAHVVKTNGKGKRARRVG